MTTIAYFDSSVWLAQILKDSRYLSFTTDAINKMEANEIRVILNKLVLMEIIQVIRVKTTQRIEYDRSLDALKKQEIRDLIESRIKDFIDAITSWEAQGKIIIPDISTPYGEVTNTAFLHIIGHSGDFHETGKCSKCKKHLNFRQYYYSGLNQWDFQHAVLAKLFPAQEFYTTDNGFKFITNDKNFESMTFYFPN